MHNRVVKEKFRRKESGNESLFLYAEGDVKEIIK
jgi:hypothetical protein